MHARICVTRARITERYGIKRRRYRINARMFDARRVYPLYFSPISLEHGGRFALVLETCDITDEIMICSICRTRDRFFTLITEAI